MLIGVGDTRPSVILILIPRWEMKREGISPPPSFGTYCNQSLAGVCLFTRSRRYFNRIPLSSSGDSTCRSFIYLFIYFFPPSAPHSLPEHTSLCLRCLSGSLNDSFLFTPASAHKHAYTHTHTHTHWLYSPWRRFVLTGGHSDSRLALQER